MPTKNTWKLWTAHLDDLAWQNMAASSMAPKIDRADPENSFELVVTLIPMGDEDDDFLLEQFRKAKLNIEDPFHWWQLLHDLLMINKKGTAGRRRIWTKAEVAKLKRQCIAAGRATPAAPATTVIAKICRRLVEQRIRGETIPNLQAQITRFELTAPIQKAIRQTSKMKNSS